MARLAFALPLALEEQYAEQAARHGHELIARASGAAEVAALAVAVRPDVVLVSSEPRYLNERVLAACDDSGVRVIALAEGDSARRYAATFGLIDTVDATAGWHVVHKVCVMIGLLRSICHGRRCRTDGSTGIARCRVNGVPVGV